MRVRNSQEEVKPGKKLWHVHKPPLQAQTKLDKLREFVLMGLSSGLRL
jgi:hypothetical protein